VRRFGLLVWLAAACLVAVGCGGEQDNAGDAAPRANGSKPQDCGKVPPQLTGSYYMRTTRDELPPELAHQPTGVNLLLLGPEHHVFARVGDEGSHGWPLCVGDGLVRFPEETEGACRGRGEGLYRWRLRGLELRLTTVRDQCIARVYSRTAHAYRRFNESGWNCTSRPNCDHKLEQIELLERTGSCEAAGCSP